VVSQSEGADRIFKIIRQNKNFDLQILKTNLQLFGINLLNIGGGLN